MLNCIGAVSPARLHWRKAWQSWSRKGKDGWTDGQAGLQIAAVWEPLGGISRTFVRAEIVWILLIAGTIKKNPNVRVMMVRVRGQAED